MSVVVLSLAAQGNQMAIYGTALLSVCLLLGAAAGTALGQLAGVDADMGGVGLAMLLLVVTTEWMHRTGRLKPPTESGIAFWGSIYIPVVVAMAATQDVLTALNGGAVALLSGAATVVACAGLVRWLSRNGPPDTADEEWE